MFYLFNTGKSNAIAINLHVEEDRIVINEQEHFLSDIKARTDFRSYCKIVFPLKQTSFDQRVIEDSFGGKHSYPYSQSPFDMFTFTSETKFTEEELSLITNQSYDVYFIFFPHHKNFKDAYLCVRKQIDENIPFNITTLDNQNNIIEYIPDKNVNQITSWNDKLYPKCSLEVLSSSIVNGILNYTIEFTYKDLDGNFVSCDFVAYLKTTKGFLSHRKLNIKNGKAQFKYIPLGLNSDDLEKAIIQLGIGKYTYITTIEV